MDTIEDTEILVFPDTRPRVLPFIDLRWHQFYNNLIACNAGVGIRIVADSHCMIFGFNGYYDFRNTHHEPYHQLACGLEMLSERWGLRLNGYLPVGGKEGLLSSCTQTEGVYFLTRKIFEIAMKGVNLEAQVQLNRHDSFAVNLYGGPYFYQGTPCRRVIGGQLGIRASLWEWVSLGFSGTYDKVYNARLQGVLAVTIPLGNAAANRGLGNQCNLADKIFKQPVRRNEIVALDSKCAWKWNY